MNKLSKIVLPALTLAACGLYKSKTNTSNESNTKTTQDYQALQFQHFDLEVNPADDIYNFVNGSWMKTNDIPADRGRWGSFDELIKRADEQTFEVLEEAIASGKYGINSPQGKAVTVYKMYMDTVARNQAGISPLVPYLQEIEEIKTIADIDNYSKKNIMLSGNPLINIGVGADVKSSTENVVYIGGGSLGLPDRDYYFDTSSRSKAIRAEYVKFIKSMFNQFYEMGYENIGQEILNFETQIAESKMTKLERRNPQARYNPMTVGAIDSLLTTYSVKEYLKLLNLNTAKVIVSEPKFLKKADELSKSGNIAMLKKYMLWQNIRSSSTDLNMQLDRMSFNFYGKFLRGTPEQRPIKERALGAANGALGEALGQLYVDKFFPAEAKKAAEKLVADLKEAYAIRINNLDWMSAETKIKAIEKLKAINVKIGYPDKWETYAGMNLKSAADGGTFFTNNLEIGRWAYTDNLNEYGKPVDKTKWGMSPQTVNAYYNPVYNEIVFPAAILQAPFFDYRADAAVNYGGIGAVIGHEISHGFDDQGAQFDANGNLNNWWTKEDLAKFQERGKKLAEQFDAFEPLPGMHINGEFTLGENIGDLGGINAAYDALKIALKRDGNPGMIDNYSPEQRYFLSWCTIWRGKMRDGELENRLKTDPHSPGYFRAIAPPSNMDEFYILFNVSPENKMYRKPEDRVKIW